MAPPGPPNVTELLRAWRGGSADALGRLIPLIYDELRAIASRRMRNERRASLRPTALVNEAYLRLAGAPPPDWQDRAHFFGVAARLMRQILVDHARARQAAKRGGGMPLVSLDAAAEPAAAAAGEVDVLALDRALARLAERDAGQARIVELRYFGGLTIEETAAQTSLSPATVKREWSMARAWLRRELEEGGG